MKNLKKWIDKIQESWNIASHRQMILCFVLLLAITISYQFAQKPTSSDSVSDRFEPDTVIPAGLVLHPIRLENIESISALIEKFGLIDLYVGNQLESGSKKIATKVKLIRAPLNPNEFALLIPQAVSEKIMRERGLFWGVIHNRSAQNNPETDNPERRSIYNPVRIEYHKGNL